MRVYARKARLVLSSTFVEFMFFFLSFMLLSKFVLLLPTQISLPSIPYPNFSFKENLYSRKLAIKKNLAIQESTHFRFVILVVISLTAKINFLINFSSSWLSFVILVIPDCLKLLSQCHNVI